VDVLTRWIDLIAKAVCLHDRDRYTDGDEYPDDDPLASDTR